MNIKTFTTFNISKMLDVSRVTVTNWINEKKLKAYTTPGGHHRVEFTDLLIFLKKYKMPIPQELESSNRNKILIIDDDLNILKIIVKALKNQKGKYETFTAKDGFEAGQALSDFNPDLVVLDIMLPGIDGFKICKLIRERKKNVKIIAITGYGSEENKKRIIAAGANLFLSKPFDVEKLLKKIDILL